LILEKKISIAGVYSKSDNHVVLILVDLKKNILYYLDPFGNQQKSRLHFTAYKNWWYAILKKHKNQQLIQFF
jgi:hypothetical protein